MPCCLGCIGYPAAERQFGSAIAQGDLERYRRKGPDASSRLLLHDVRDALRQGDALLDVGAGVGVLSFELLSSGVESATLVDASPPYLTAAQGEAERRDVARRVHLMRGDLVELDREIEPVDVVAMHRVVCCYPDWAALLTAATRLSRRVFAFSYPRDRWFVRVWLAFQNTRRRISGNPFRSFVHPVAAMEERVAAAGFRRIHHARTSVWGVEVYTREHAA